VQALSAFSLRAILSPECIFGIVRSAVFLARIRVGLRLTRHAAFEGEVGVLRILQMERKKVRVGIVGYGSLGQYLVKAINEDPKAKQTLELAFVWNRTTQKILDDKENKIPPNLILEDLGTLNSAFSSLLSCSAIRQVHRKTSRLDRGGFSSVDNPEIWCRIPSTCRSFCWITYRLCRPIF